MKLSVSNIAWDASKDMEVYNLMKKMEYHGLEIAPTRIFVDKPYEQLNDAKIWSGEIKEKFGLDISSMQSIWFGKQGKLFESKEDRKELLEYTQKAIDFAKVINCKNLVFGCPRNRNIPENFDEEIAVSFFRELGEYAASNETTIGMEANPTIYNTNYINNTMEALELIEKVNSDGFKLNLDFGTIVQNDELISELHGRVKMINHVHISEPGLKPIEHRDSHIELNELLRREAYKGYVSIEMGKVDDISILTNTMKYIKEIFG